MSQTAKGIILFLSIVTVYTFIWFLPDFVRGENYQSTPFIDFDRDGLLDEVIYQNNDVYVLYGNGQRQHVGEAWCAEERYEVLNILLEKDQEPDIIVRLKKPGRNERAAEKIFMNKGLQQNGLILWE